jgi:thiol-disulfide isomerase/thioredoxin
MPVYAAQEIRTWTSASGKTIEASFVELKYGQVILQPPAGEPIKISLAKLSSADQIYVGSQSKPAGTISAPPPAPGATTAAPELEALFGKRLVNAKGKKIPTADLAGKKIGIYFSASWCPPCRAFTPQLVAAYNQLQTEGKAFEVVLVSSDRDERSMEAYMKDHDMPWLAIPFGEKQIAALKQKFAVVGIPKLVVVDAAGATLSAEARGEVMATGAKAFDRW